MSRYLTKEWVALCGLPYDSMKLQLKANGVITDQQRDEIDDLVGTNKMDKVLKIVQNGLDLKLPKKYRGFLKSMEESKDDTLIEYAKSLGESVSSYNVQLFYRFIYVRMYEVLIFGKFVRYHELANFTNSFENISYKLKVSF